MVQTEKTAEPVGSVVPETALPIPTVADQAASSRLRGANPLGFPNRSPKQKGAAMSSEQNPALTINTRLANLLPPLSADEYAKLEESILAEGVRDPIVVWRMGNVLIIVDGHYRYRIAMEHGIPFSVIEMEFEDEDAVCIWIIKNQLGRRNLTDAQRTFHIGELYKLRKKKSGAPEGNQNAAKQFRHDVGVVSSKVSGKTAEQVAKSHNVSSRTVERAANFHTAITEIARATGKTPHAILGLADIARHQNALILATMPEEQQRAMVVKLESGEAKSVVDARRIITTKLMQNAPLLNADAKYRVVYADPPWQYQKPTGSGAPENHYSTMSLDKICKLMVCGKSVAELTEDDAVLFLWVPVALSIACAAVIEAWGFTYKTQYVWDKVKHGLGCYNSVRHELLLVATKGSCTPDTTKVPDSVQVIERSNKHSEKPEKFREIIDTLYSSGKRIELFARKITDGWDAWGDEIEGIFHDGSKSPSKTDSPPNGTLDNEIALQANSPVVDGVRLALGTGTNVGGIADTVNAGAHNGRVPSCIPSPIPIRSSDMIRPSLTPLPVP